MKDEHLVSAYNESQEIWIIVKIVFCVADIFKQFLNLFSVGLVSLYETGCFFSNISQD